MWSQVLHSWDSSVYSWINKLEPIRNLLVSIESELKRIRMFIYQRLIWILLRRKLITQWKNIATEERSWIKEGDSCHGNTMHQWRLQGNIWQVDADASGFYRTKRNYWNYKKWPI